MKETQELTAARDRYDRERARLVRLGEFSTRAIQARTLPAFGEVVSRALVEVFGFEFGGIWIFPGDLPGVTPVSAVAGCRMTAAGLSMVRDWLRQRMPDLGTLRMAAVAAEEAAALAGVLPVRRLVVASCGDSGTPATALILGGLSGVGERGREDPEPERIESFMVFLRQVAALLGNRVGQLMVEGQMRRIQVSEESQREAREQAEAANRAKSTFLANMSHEIRTPLNGVLGMLQLLSNSKPSSEQLGLIEAAEQSATRLLEILEDVLDLSRIESGKVELGMAPFDLAALVREVLRSLENRARVKGIQLELELAPDLPGKLLGDPLRLRQVLSNLIGNGIKFTTAGSVKVTAWAMPPAPDDRVWIELSIRDTGIGIPGEIQGTLFAPFVQADGSATRRYGGAGLGLAISRLTVELMGGRIWVESEAEKGADFRLRLPFRVEPAPAVAPVVPAARPTPGQLFNARVLVVEENAIGQRVARLMLESLGIVVDVASEGASAVRAAEGGQYQLLLLDCRLPDIDGFEAARRIRQHEARTGTPRLPIVALATRAGETERAAWSAAGMDGYLLRPLRRVSLIERLREFLPAA